MALTRPKGSAWQTHENLGVYCAWDFDIKPSNTASQNNAGWTALIAAMPTNGGKILFPGAEDPYEFSEILSPPAKVWIQGAGGARPNGTNYSGTTLCWTGGATAFINLDAQANTGSILEGFNIDNTGTGTVAISYDACSNHLLRDVSISQPDTEFSSYGINVGPTNNVHTFKMENCLLRTCAPTLLRLNRISLFNVITNCTFRNGSDQCIQVGDANNCQDTHFIGCNIENGGEGHGVSIDRGESVWLDHCHFEVTGAYEALRIDSSANKAENIRLTNSYLTAGASTTQLVVANFASTRLWVEGNTVINNTGSTLTFVQNTSSLFVRVIGNQLDASTTILSSYTNAVAYDNFVQTTGQLDGPFRASSAVIVGNVGAGADTLVSYSFPANTFFEDGHWFRAVIRGQTAANANNKTLVVSFDGTSLYDSGAVAANDDDWYIEIVGIRSTSTGMRFHTTGYFNNAIIATNVVGVTVANWTAARVLLCTGESGSSVTDDIETYGYTIEVFR